MKRRRLKLFALMMAASLTFSATIPVVAKADNEIAYQQVDSDESVQNENWTEEIVSDSEGNLIKVIFRKYENTEDKSTFEYKWVYTKEDNRWRYYGENREDAKPLALEDGIYQVGIEGDGKDSFVLNYSLIVNSDDETAGIPYGGWWEERQDEDGTLYSYHYFLLQEDVEEDSLPVEGLEAPTEFMANQVVRLDIEGKIHNFWLDEEGYPVRSVWETDQEDETSMYYFDESGEMATYWKKVDGNYFWFGRADDGVKKTYWQKIYGKYYWLGADGAMRTGWQKVYGKYYWLGHSNDGAMKTGWQKVYGKYYWLGHSNDGAMKTGWQKVYGKWYYLGNSNDGAMKTGWQKVYGKWYYLGNSNDGAMKTGWQTISGKKYYLGGDGAMRTGWQTISGKKYYFGSDGALKTTK